MTIRRMEHVGIVVDDLADAIGFFAELGLELQPEAERAAADHVVDRLERAGSGELDGGAEGVAGGEAEEGALR